MQNFFHVVTGADTQLITGKLERIGAGSPHTCTDNLERHEKHPPRGDRLQD